MRKVYFNIVILLLATVWLLIPHSAIFAGTLARMYFPEEINIQLQNLKNDGDKIAYLMDASWQNRVSNPVLSLNILRYTLNMASKSNNDYAMASVYNYSGVVNYHLMNYVEAIDCFKQAAICAEKSQNYLQHAYAYNNMSLVYNETEKYRSSLEMAHKSLDLMKKMHNRRGEISPLSQLSLTFSAILQYDSASYYAKKIQKKALEQHDKFAMIRYHKCMGVMYSYMAEYEQDKEDDYFDNGFYHFFAVYDSTARTFGIDNDIAKLYALQGKYSEAVKYALEGLEAGRKIDSPKQIKSAIKIIYENIEKSNKKDSVEYYFRYLYGLQDSLSSISLNSQVFAVNNASQLRITDMQNHNVASRYDGWRKIGILFTMVLIMMFSFLLYQAKLNKELKRKNAIMKDRIVQRSLLTAKLEDSIAVKDKFISIVAHDLRNPIGSYNSLTSTIETEYDNFGDEERKEFLKTMKHSAENVRNLLTNLLRWSNAQQGKLTLHLKYFDITQVADDTIKLLEVQAMIKQITLINELGASCEVLADEELITIVIRNLISNAIKFTNQGGMIRFGMNNESFDEDRFYIRDNGVGMSPEKVANLFDVSKSASETGTFGEKGTGLGLAISYEIIKLHGGDIIVESEIGKGTTFYFTIKATKLK